MFPAQADLAGLMDSLRCYYPFATLVPNHPTSLGKRERQGSPSHCPPDSVPLAPRQGRSPVTCPPDRVPSFPIISGGFALGRSYSALMNDSTDSTRIMPQMLCYVNRSELSIRAVA